MIFPLLPLFLSTLPGAPAAALGWIEGVAETTASFVKIASGRRADRAGRRKPLVVAGYGLSSAVRPLVSLATSWTAVLGLRFLDRVGKGVRSAPRDALIARVTPPDRRGAAYGLHRAMDNAGAVLGPLLAAALLASGISLRGVFALSAIPAALAVAVLLAVVREAPASAAASACAAAPACAAPAPSLPAPKAEAPPLPRAFWTTAGVVTLFTLSASSDAFILLKAREVGFAAGAVPLLWAASNAVRALLGRWGGGLSDRLGRKPLLLSAWSLYALCYAAISRVSSPPLLVLVVLVYSLHAALAEGAERALVADLVPEGSRGRAFGWLHGMTGLAALPASAGFGWLWQRHGSGTAFLAGAAVAASAAIALALLVPAHQGSDRSAPRLG